MEEFGIDTTLVADIRAGKKTIEARLGKPRFLKIKVGDTVSVREDIYEHDELKTSHTDALNIVITQKLYFESFAEMLETVDYTAAIPAATSPNDALDVYEHFYSPEDEAEYGVIAFIFTLAS
jgi:ASC-1-like (ASCH) protein